MSTAELPLAGVRVIDLGIVLAGPFGSMILGDLGADVVRVESTHFFPPATRGHFARPTKEMVAAAMPIQGGYPDRDPGERPWNRFPWFNAAGRNKRGVTMDLMRPGGDEIFRRLVALSDVIINNQTVRASERQGIDYETVRKINPGIVYVSASLFGVGGPLSHYKGGGPQMEAFCGHDDMRHYPDAEVTTNSWLVPSDAAGGVANAFGAILGLHAREATGEGQYIDLSLIENELALLGPLVLEAALSGPPQVLGNRSRCTVQGCYQTAGDDRWLTLTVPDAEGWNELAGLIGRPEWSDRPFDASLYAGHRHEEIDQAITAWTISRDRDAAIDALIGNGIWAGPVLPDGEIVEDPHLEARSHYMWLDHAEAGRHRYPGPPFRLRESAPFPQAPPVRLGEHNHEIYSELLGFDEAEIDRFRQNGHIGEDYDPEIV